PWPRDSNPPKTTPTTTSGPDRYPANSPSHHRPSPPINTTSHHHLRHPWPSLAITICHHHSHRHSRHSLGHHRCDRHISTRSWLSHHISAGTICHPRPTPRPPSHIM
ncbi:hypothetical protein C0993_011681, partial [Termitomyces sp. T159_Od127]